MKKTTTEPKPDIWFTPYPKSLLDEARKLRPNIQLVSAALANAHDATMAQKERDQANDKKAQQQDANRGQS